MIIHKIRESLFIVFVCFYIVLSKTSEDEITKSSGFAEKNVTFHENTLSPRPQPSAAAEPVVKRIDCKDTKQDDISSCPSGVECSKLGGDCLECNFNCSCVYGQSLNVSCLPKPGVDCQGRKNFIRSMICQYCFQTPSWEHECAGTASCPAVSSPRKMFKTNCSVRSEIICLGNRKFPKRVPCNWTSGYRWITALVLSITLGGFGADRFYLGHWQEGVGKLFSFGGLGVWTIIDVVLIYVRYLGPADESLYI